jgi:uracil-DNA glycosylase family 4
MDIFDFKQNPETNTLSYPELAQKCQSCTGCALHTTRQNVVVGTGHVPSTVMIIGEGPGEQEDLSGKPFVGKAGQLLTKMLESVQINRETDVFITNIVKCRPPENRNPHADEILACSGYLSRQIALVQPRILILLGAPALKTILGDVGAISTVRGTWIQKPVDYMEDPLYIMPMFHPSYLLRNASKEKGSPKWLTWQDLQEVKTALDFYKTL